MINLQVPFYANTPDNTHCYQAALKMILKYFLPGKDFSWQELDIITAKVEGLWTWPMAGLIWLKRNGFEAVDIEDFDYASFAQDGPTYLEKLYGKEVAAEQVAHSELKQEQKYALEMINEISIEQRLPEFSDITTLLEKEYLVCCNVNGHKLDDIDGYSGHFVVIKGYTAGGLVLHDPGLPAVENREVDNATFLKAWAYPDEKAKNLMAFKLQNTT